MEKQKQSKASSPTSNSMSPMDQGLNLVFQTVNNATGLDKENDGKINNKE
jgi:hypothetical protein